MAVVPKASLIKSINFVGVLEANNLSNLARTTPLSVSRHTISETGFLSESRMKLLGDAVHGISISFGIAELSSVVVLPFGADAFTLVQMWNSSTSEPNSSVTVSAYPQMKIDIQNQVLEIIEKAGKSTAGDIRDGSPRRNGVYEKGWTHETIEDIAVVYNNGKEKSLAHLLENGHATKNGGFVAPQEHIRPAYLKNKEIFLNNMKSIKIRPN